MMPLASLVHLYRVRLRARLVQELLALAGIAVGVALVFAALVANESLTGSVQQLTSGIVGQARYQLAARGPEGFPERVLDDVQRADGVRAAAPILETRANVVGRDGRRRSVVLVGGDPRFARIGGPLLRNFTASELARQRAVALPAPLAAALGVVTYQPVRVETGAGTTTAPLGAELQASGIGALIHSPVAVAPLVFAQEMSGMQGRVSRIFVEPEPGRERAVEAALERIAGDRLNVRDARHDVAVFEQAASPTNQSTAMFSVFSALVGFLFAFSAVLLTVPQRRRLVGDLRLAGYEPSVQVQVLLFDALVLGLAGAGLGLALGDQLSRHVLGSTPGYLADAFPVGEQRIVTVRSVAVAAAAGVVAACFAVLAPLREILSRRVEPREPGRRDEPAARRAAVGAGLVCLLVTTLIVLLAPTAALAGLIALTAALLLLLPLLLRGATAAVATLTRSLRTPVPTLAVLELRAGATSMRTLALAATGAIAVFATVSIGGAHADLTRGLDGAAHEIDANADVWVTFPGGTSPYAATPLALPAGLPSALAELPGVRSIGVYRGSFLDVGDQRAWIQAPPRDAPAPIPAGQLREGDPELAARRLRAGGWVVLSETIADAQGAGVGDVVELPTPVPRRLRVAAISTNLGWPSGAIVLGADDYARAWGSLAPSALLLRLDPASSPEAVARAVREAIGTRLPVNVETQEERVAVHVEGTREGLSRLSQISVLVLLSAMLAMAAAMAGTIWQRRPAFAGLKVHGYGEGELWRALLLESGILLGTACFVGAVFGLFGQLLLSRALETITGFPVLYSTAGLVAVGILSLVTSVAIAMLAVPGYLAVRVPPAPSTAT